MVSSFQNTTVQCTHYTHANRWCEDWSHCSFLQMPSWYRCSSCWTVFWGAIFINQKLRNVLAWILKTFPDWTKFVLLSMNQKGAIPMCTSCVLVQAPNLLTSIKFHLCVAHAASVGYLCGAIFARAELHKGKKLSITLLFQHLQSGMILLY